MLPRFPNNSGGLTGRCRPAAVQIQLKTNQCRRIFLKLDASGSSVVYGTYFGTPEDYDGSFDVQLDPQGAAYFTGISYGFFGSTPLPTTTNAFDQSPNGVHDAFVTKFGAGFDGSLRFDNETSYHIPIVPCCPPVVIEAPIAVGPLSGTIEQVQVSLRIAHTFDFDLQIALVGPDGTTVPLATDRGSSGDDYGTACQPDSSRTTFDDGAATPVGLGTSRLSVCIGRRRRWRRLQASLALS